MKLGIKKTEELTLPSTAGTPEEVKLVVRTSLLPSDMEIIQADSGSNVDKTANLLSVVIESWTNVTGEQNEPLEPTVDNIKQLPLADFSFLDQYLADLLKKETAGLSDEENLGSSASLIAEPIPTISPLTS